MFTWSIAKSAEAMFSRWAVKRLCKFLLKKKLGQFILGDIDLNQLDVQLRAGTIQLSDLALNVGYINHKLGTASVFVKEGSIGLLKVTMPWTDGGCRIEVDELEVVIAPRRVKVSEDKHKSCSDTKKDQASFSHVSSKLENEVANSELTNVSVDVHEGVKTIAKMVKWLLTSFHVQINKLIVAFDPLLEEENKKRLDQILVLRIGEVECGTHISEDSSSGSSTKVHNFLGFSRLENFMKFQGAVLELLHMDGLEHQSPTEVHTETHLVDWFSGHCPSGSMTTIVSGEKGGFSGNLKLSIPWKNGSLDICKVDADLSIEPLELRLQPSTIRCFIFLWGLFKDIGEECEDHNNNGLNSSSATSYCIPPDQGILSSEGFADNFYVKEKEPTNALLSDSHLISDWASKSHKERNDEEPDFGASMDQFFECFDGLRNSQSALGNSGMWNWTCSVFTAITAASNLASGSLHVSCETDIVSLHHGSEQQQVETNFDVSISKVSLLFSFSDEDQKEPSKTKNDTGDTASHIRCVCAQLVDLSVVFQVCSREMKFESNVHHIQLIDHLYSKNESRSVDARCCNGNSKSEIFLIQQMQDGVQSALRTFEKSNKDQGLDHCGGGFVDISLCIQDSDSCSHISNRNDFYSEDASVKFLQTSGVSQCHVTLNSGSSGGLLLGPTSFSLKMAPFVFWVNFDLIILMLDFLNEMAKSVKQTAMESGFVLKSEGKTYGPSPLSDQGKISLQPASMTKKRLEANMLFPNARIILCFPLSGHKNFSSYLCGEQFIIFDIVSSNIGGKKNPSAKPKPLGGTYSVEHLRKTGYVKVAQEANVEVLLRKNCENGHAWELECDESHIVLTTCHDTALGLFRLAAQLQKLFAPDIQEHVVHLENRWINAQQVYENMDERILGNNSPPSVSHTQTSSLDIRPKTSNLMDEICEDVFQLDGNSDGQAKFFEPHIRLSSTDISFGEQCFGVPEHRSADLPHTGNFSALGVGASMGTSLDKKIPELIEEYFFSDLQPLSELALKSHPSDMFYCKSHAVGVAQTGNCGWYEDTSLRILENHASKVNKQSNVWQLIETEASSSDSKIGDLSKAEGCIIFMNMNVVWRIYGGSDWFNLQNISRSSAMMTSGRDATICFELELSGIEFDYKFYPDGEISASRLSLTVQDFCLNDKSDHAPWKLVLGYYRSKKHPRMFSSKAVKLNLDAVKPDPSIPLEENRLRIALLPMRLHLHQSQLDFFINFFGNNNSSEPSPGTPSVSKKSGEQPEKTGNFLGQAISAEAFLPYFQASSFIICEGLIILAFLQKFDIWPLLIRVDYSPCHVDLTALSGGKYVELVNLVPWKDVELRLKHVQGVGLYGWNSVCETILGEWLEDISKNQVHKLLKGLPPIKSLVAVGSGAAKLVSLPVKNYRKDHRLIKGMQRGTIAFLRSISLEAIGLGVHLAAGAHNILLQAEYILSNIPPSVPWQVESRVVTNVRSNQPKDAQQGIHQACQSITDGLGKSASALIQTPLKKLQRGAGVGSTLATAVQATPAAAIAPASATAHAVHCALLGFRNSLDPERKRDSLEKYLGRARAPPRESMQ
ncbi:hypothetical protein F511_24349 [Dorcoceras hygrometricum]|uniref:Autophagy-related protein 2 n=1 Tax=Dorcoceras hygrometricum TaxID=472368 RepID=A0A2Z7DE84_9LAMI|nr:hypothetical protein F511_24349 [Dorcoceras hygrometricum]